MTINHPRPYVLGNGEGEGRPFLDTLITVKASGAQTGGTFGLIEQELPVGSETSYHVHHAEDEYWYVLEGEATFISGELRVRVAAGSFVCMPRGVPHGLRTHTAARFLVFSTPSGFVDFAIEMSHLSTEKSSTITEERKALSAKYQIEVLGPLPE